MSDATFFLTKNAFRHHKRIAAQLLTGVSSSHLSEAVAACFGFKTYAALLAAFRGKKSLETPKPCNQKFNQRLVQFGYPAPNQHCVLELDRSYTPFHSPALNTQRNARWRAWRNLMVGAINAGLQRQLFGLEPGENWWPGFKELPSYTYDFELEGLGQARANVHSVEHDVLSLSVILKPKNPDIIPNPFRDLTNGQAVAAGWFERRLGAWIQDGGEEFRCKRLLLPQLADLSIEPLGYSDQGSFSL